MPLALLLVGIAFAVAALRNTHKELATQLATDFSGSNNFAYWVAAIMVIGLLGYIPTFKTPSRLLLGLVFLSLLLSNGGFFAQLKAALASGAAATATEQTPKEPAPPQPLTVELIGAGGSGSDKKSDASGTLGEVAGIAKAATSIFGLF